MNLHRGPLVKEQPELWQRLAQTGKDPGQQEWRNRRDHTETQRTGERRPLCVGERHEGFDAAQAQPCLCRHLLAQCGDGDPPVGAVHKTHPQRCLELADGNTERRLGHEAGSGGLAEVPVLGQGRKVVKLSVAGQSHVLFYKSF